MATPSSRPDYVTAALDQAAQLRTEALASGARAYSVATDTLHRVATTAQPDLERLVDVTFGTVEAVVARGRSVADSLVAASTRLGA